MNDWKCCVCGRSVELGPSVWTGRYVPQWKLIIHSSCESLNHDGVVIRTFPNLPAKIEAAGGRYTVNTEGHIVVPALGSLT